MTVMDQLTFPSLTGDEQASVREKRTVAVAQPGSHDAFVELGRHALSYQNRD